MDALATFDPDLIKHLKDEARIVVATPDDCWQRLPSRTVTAINRVVVTIDWVRAAWWRW